MKTLGKLQYGDTLLSGGGGGRYKGVLSSQIMVQPSEMTIFKVIQSSGHFRYLTSIDRLRTNGQ